MPKNKTITVFTLAELKELHPEAFEKALDKIRANNRNDETPWGDEIRQSVMATIEACGAKARDWRVGPWSPSYIDVVFPDDVYDDDGNDLNRDLNWYIEYVLSPKGYGKTVEEVKFPGNCALTGYCFDDDCLEHVFKQLQSGETMEKALESLADLWSKQLEAEEEYNDREDAIMEAHADDEFTVDGKRFRF